MFLVSCHADDDDDDDGGKESGIMDQADRSCVGTTSLTSRVRMGRLNVVTIIVDSGYMFTRPPSEGMSRVDNACCEQMGTVLGGVTPLVIGMNF